jgi:hypothetical protein
MWANPTPCTTTSVNSEVFYFEFIFNSKSIMLKLMKRLNQKGFHLLYIALIVIIIAGLGFAGWYVWDKNQKTDTATEIAPTPTPNEYVDHDKAYVDRKNETISETGTTTLSADGLMKTYADALITFTYPSDWLFGKHMNDYGFSTPENDLSSKVEVRDPSPLCNSTSCIVTFHATLSFYVPYEYYTRDTQQNYKAFASEEIPNINNGSYLIISRNDPDPDFSGPNLVSLHPYDVGVNEMFNANYSINIGNGYKFTAEGDFWLRDINLVPLIDAETYKNTEEYQQFAEIVKSVVINTETLPDRPQVIVE